MSKRKIPRRWALLLVLAVTVLAPGQDNKRQQAARTAPQKAQTTSPAARGLKVFIDPVTGAIREAEQEEQSALAPLVAEAAAVPQPLTHPSGAVGLQLGEDQMVFSVATIGPDGKLKMDCITGKKHAEAKVQATPLKGQSDAQ